MDANGVSKERPQQNAFKAAEKECTAHPRLGASEARKDLPRLPTVEKVRLAGDLPVASRAFLTHAARLSGSESVPGKPDMFSEKRPAAALDHLGASLAIVMVRPVVASERVAHAGQDGSARPGGRW